MTITIPSPDALDAMWYPVEAPDNGGSTDWVIMAGNPITGECIGNYTGPTAFWVSRLHNLNLPHRPHHGPMHEIDAMFQSEIDFVIAGLWDGGINWYIGNGPTVHAQVVNALEANTVDRPLVGNAATIEEVLVDLRNAARIAYPDSIFARSYSYQTELNTDQRSDEELTRLVSDKFGGDVELLYQPQTDPYESSWTLTAGGRGFAGDTISDALRNALDTEV